MLFSSHRSAGRILGRSSDRGLVLAVLLIACASALAWAGAPSTQSIIDTALRRLCDRDPAVREAARVQLMGLRADDLPELRAAVESAQPLAPGQAEALHEIVAHLYLSGQNQDGDADHGFIGVLMRHDFDSVRADDDNDDSDQPLGVVVDGRVPGFAAYRLLRDGDVILGVALDGQDADRVRSMFDVSGLIGRLAPGQRIRLNVLRGGRRIDVALTLDPRPKELSPTQPTITFESYREEQDAKAEAYWLKDFASLVDIGVS